MKIYYGILPKDMVVDSEIESTVRLAIEKVGEL